ncbi:MAG TPA: hypothetical protein VE569_11065 [Acidimicrobiia bacterium]|nr:hypothetical protein [Acidimicrobiia bacterium]
MRRPDQSTEINMGDALVSASPDRLPHPQLILFVGQGEGSGTSHTGNPTASAWTASSSRRIPRMETLAASS